MAERIRAMIAASGLTQIDYAKNILHVSPSSLTKYLVGERYPDAFTCLLLAGAALSEKDRVFFLKLGGIEWPHVRLALAAAGKHIKSLEDGIHYWLQTPGTRHEEALKLILKEIVLGEESD